MDVCRHNYDTIFDYKSQFNPKLTMFERDVVTDLWNSKHRAGLTAETDPFVAGLRAFVECRIRGDEIADAVTYSYRCIDAAPKPATASETVNPATAGKSEQSPTRFDFVVRMQYCISRPKIAWNQTLHADASHAYYNAARDSRAIFVAACSSDW